MSNVRIDKIWTCLNVLDEIIITHTDSNNLKNIARKGIKKILKQSNEALCNKCIKIEHEIKETK